MSWFTQVQWLHPWILAALALIPWLWYVHAASQKETRIALNAPAIQHIPTRNTWRVNLYRYSSYLVFFSLASLILALARPQYILREEKINAEGIDIFMVMDLSSSMLSQDFEPNRLEVSKDVAMEFIRERRYDRIGIVAFAGEGYTQCPLTVDHTVLSNLMNELQCGFLEDGTAIGMGLATAINRLKDDSLTKSKVIILITDGVNNAGDISPELAAELAKTYGVKLYAIGVGTRGEAYSPVGRNFRGDYIFGMAPVNIDEELLSRISAQTGGKYYRATNKERLKEIYQEIDQLEKTKVEVKTYKRYSEEYARFLWLGLGLLFLRFLIRYSLNPLAA